MPTVVEPVTLSNYYLWLGVPDLSSEMLKSFDPAYTGHVHIFMIRTPGIFNMVGDDQHGKNLRTIMERVSTSFSGIPELNLNYQDQTHGFADRKVPHATHSEFNFDQATIRVLEFKGLPVYNLIREWIENISDPISKIKDYKGKALDEAKLPGGYTLKNHTCSFIVCTTDPTNTQIQGRAHYITAASPVSISNEHFNWNSGEISIVEGFDINLRGVIRYGKTIDEKAKALLDQRRKVINYYADKMHAGGTLNGDTLAAQTVVM